ncbi:MAG: metalloregulator ArsR/SmtB family transcription factor [Lachnospiraceae bacterium]|nr:metalloregulator ArsR/SmtB family transcription factor [Lachnospiraceae bacterium]
MSTTKIMEMCKAAGNTERMNILVLLKNDKMNVTSILKHVSIKQSTLSHHLTILFESGLLNKEEKGREIFYSMNKEAVKALGNSLIEFAEN